MKSLPERYQPTVPLFRRAIWGRGYFAVLTERPGGGLIVAAQHTDSMHIVAQATLTEAEVLTCDPELIAAHMFRSAGLE